MHGTIKTNRFQSKNDTRSCLLKANSPKSFADMPRSKSSESNSSTASTSSTASKSSASPLSKRATMKGLRTEKRSERKLTRQARRENRIVNKTAKLKAKR